MHSTHSSNRKPSSLKPESAPHGVPTLTPEQLAAFGAELDALRKRVVGELGAEDARYIRDMVARARLAEVSGRALLLAGLFPPAWLAGVGLLTLSKVIENMEIGHNVLHGQYDFLNEPALAGATYEWDWSCPAAAWRHSHNYVHHTYTNIVGKDRDIGYGLLRMAEEQPWHPAHTLQPLYAALQALTFEWAVAVHDLELDAVLSGNKTLAQLWQDAQPTLRKTFAQGLKDFVLYPALSGPAAPAVFAGNLSANLLRNVWAFSVIFCGHFPDGVQTFAVEPSETDAPDAPATRGAWYLRQILGSANCEGSRAFHVLSGHLSHQIEHHLFPDLPAPRYAQLAPEVQAICRKYGVAYNTNSFTRQLSGALRRIVRCALPPSRDRHAAQAAVTQAAQVDQLDQLHQSDQLQQLDPARAGQVDHVDQVDQVDQLDRVAQTVAPVAPAQPARQASARKRWMGPMLRAARERSPYGRSDTKNARAAGVIASA